MSPLMISLLAFVAVSGVVGLVAYMLRDYNSGRTESRLDVLVGRRAKSDQSTEILRKTAFESDQKSLMELITPNFPSVQKVFEQADCNIKPSTLLGIALVLAVLGMTASVMARIPWYLAPLSGLVMFCVPLGWLWNKRRSRLSAFAAQLPEALELVARALRAGHSLQAGMHVVAEEMPSPISDEFGRVYEEQNLGIPVEESLRNLSDRIPNLDLRFFVTSVSIQRQTGGDLAEILDKIGYVIRERYRILGQVKALTAEGRLSGIVLISLPFGLFLFLLYTKADYVSMLWTHKMGIQMAVGGLILQVLGAITIKKIVDIKV